MLTAVITFWGRSRRWDNPIRFYPITLRFGGKDVWLPDGLLDCRDQISRIRELVDYDFRPGHFGQQHVVSAIRRGYHDRNVIAAQTANQIKPINRELHKVTQQDNADGRHKKEGSKKGEKGKKGKKALFVFFALLALFASCPEQLPQVKIFSEDMWGEERSQSARTRFR